MAIAFGHKLAAADCAIGQQPDLQPRSVSKVVAVIRKFSGKGISQKEIIAATGLSERTVKYAISLLENSGIVTRLLLPNDLRKRIYTMRAMTNETKSRC